MSRDSEFNGNQPAHPISCAQPEVCYGLTKREYFAGLAMQGTLASMGYDDMCKFSKGCKNRGSDAFQGIALGALAAADALLAELSK